MELANASLQSRGSNACRRDSLEIVVNGSVMCSDSSVRSLGSRSSSLTDVFVSNLFEEWNLIFWSIWTESVAHCFDGFRADVMCAYGMRGRRGLCYLIFLRTIYWSFSKSYASLLFVGFLGWVIPLETRTGYLNVALRNVDLTSDVYKEVEISRDSIKRSA